MESFNQVGDISRALAYLFIAVFFIGTIIGSLSPESGNLLAHILGVPEGRSHIFNPCFLVLGIVGIVLACAIGHRLCR